MECQLISLYNISNKALTVVSREYKPRLMCVGREGSLLVMHGRNQVIRLKWNGMTQELKISHVAEIQPQFVRKMCFVQKHGVLVVTSYPPGMNVRISTIPNHFCSHESRAWWTTLQNIQ